MSKTKKPWEAWERWAVVALFLVTVLSRLPFRSQILYHWDSVNFAFAMRSFDLTADQPQAPGYIAYVWLCRLVDILFRDPQTTMVWIAVVSSGLAVVALYLLGRALFGRGTGLAAALFLASSPLFWFYGEIALPHAVDMFLVILSAWLLYEMAQGRSWAVIPAAVSLAVAGGIRQQTPVFLAPVTLFAAVLYLRRAGWREGLGWGIPAVAAFALICAGWFFPLIRSVGGFAEYRQLLSAFSEHYDRTTSLFLGAGMTGLVRNVRKLSMYTLYGWSVASVPALVYGGRCLVRRPSVSWERVAFILCWIAPSLFFYVAVHMGQQGLVFVFLPVLLLIGAEALVRLTEGRRGRVFATGLGLLLVINTVLFIALPEYPLGGERFKVLSLNTVRNNDAYYQDRFDLVRERLPSTSTAVVAVNWRHVSWYLPEYVCLPFSLTSKWEIDEGEPVSGGVAAGRFTADELGLSGEVTVVLFDPDLDAFDRTSSEATFALPLEGGGQMIGLRLKPGEVLHLEEEGIGIDGETRSLSPRGEGQRIG